MVNTQYLYMIYSIITKFHIHIFINTRNFWTYGPLAFSHCGDLLAPLGSEFFWVQKKLSEKSLVWKIFSLKTYLVWKNVWSENFWAVKILVWIFFCSEKCWSETAQNSPKLNTNTKLPDWKWRKIYEKLPKNGPNDLKMSGLLRQLVQMRPGIPTPNCLIKSGEILTKMGKIPKIGQNGQKLSEVNN